MDCRLRLGLARTCPKLPRDAPFCFTPSIPATMGPWFPSSDLCPILHPRMTLQTPSQWSRIPYEARVTWLPSPIDFDFVFVISPIASRARWQILNSGCNQVRFRKFWDRNFDRYEFIMKIMVRTVKWFQISRFWENITSQNKLLNVVTVIEPSLQEEKAHWLLSTNLNGNLNFTAIFLLEEPELEFRPWIQPDQEGLAVLASKKALCCINSIGN
jgi:hypothetical protein